MICVGFLRAGLWIPSQNGEAILMMHEVTFRIVNVTKSSRFGLSKTDHRQDQRPWLWEKDHVQHVGLRGWDGGFPPGRYLHSFCVNGVCSHLGGTNMWLQRRR